MFKAIYAASQHSGTPAYRLVAVFDEEAAQACGMDDADYSQIDDLIETLGNDGRKVLVQDYPSLEQVELGSLAPR